MIDPAEIFLHMHEKEVINVNMPDFPLWSINLVDLKVKITPGSTPIWNQCASAAAELAGGHRSRTTPSVSPDYLPCRGRMVQLTQ
jgi:hypothetical protein